MSSDKVLCETCIRQTKPNECSKGLAPSIEDGGCKYFIEKEKYLAQIAPPKAKEFVTEPKTDLKDIEIGRLRSENNKLRSELANLRKLLPPDPVGELLTRLLPKLRICLEKGVITGYRNGTGEKVQLVDSFNYRKLKDLGLVTDQERTVTYTKKTAWFSPEFEAKVRERLAEAQ